RYFELRAISLAIAGPQKDAEARRQPLALAFGVPLSMDDTWESQPLGDTTDTTRGTPVCFCSRKGAPHGPTSSIPKSGYIQIPPKVSGNCFERLLSSLW